MKIEYVKKIFEACLNDLSKVLNPFDKIIYIHYFENNTTSSQSLLSNVEKLVSNLKMIGISDDKLLYDKLNARPGFKFSKYQFMDIALRTSEIVLIVGSEDLKKNYSKNITDNLFLILNDNYEGNRKILIPVWFEKKFEDNFPMRCWNIKGCSLIDYYNEFFFLVESLYQLNPMDNIVIQTREKFNRIISRKDLFDEYKVHQLEIKKNDQKELEQILGI